MQIIQLKRGKYVLEPKSQGYESNEWTEFDKQMMTIPRKHWIDERYTVITRPRYVAACRESRTEIIIQDMMKENIKHQKTPK